MPAPPGFAQFRFKDSIHRARPNDSKPFNGFVVREISAPYVFSGGGMGVAMSVSNMTAFLRSSFVTLRGAGLAAQLAAAQQPREAPAGAVHPLSRVRPEKIGRASCRERV